MNFLLSEGGRPYPQILGKIPAPMGGPLKGKRVALNPTPLSCMNSGLHRAKTFYLRRFQI